MDANLTGTSVEWSDFTLTGVVGERDWPGELCEAKRKTAGMAKKRKRAPKSVLKLPDLEQSKLAVLNSLPSISSQRSYEHAIREFIDWHCPEPRLAFNKTVVTR